MVNACSTRVVYVETCLDAVFFSQPLWRRLLGLRLFLLFLGRRALSRRAPFAAALLGRLVPVLVALRVRGVVLLDGRRTRLLALDLGVHGLLLLDVVLLDALAALLLVGVVAVHRRGHRSINRYGYLPTFYVILIGH